jgi:signal transduction histidine kinase
MSNQETTGHWRQLTILVLRWLFLAGVTLAVLLLRDADNTTFDLEDSTLALVGGGGAIAALVISGTAFITALQPATGWLFMLFDVVIAGLYIHLTQAPSLLILFVVVYLLVTLLPALDLIAGAFYVLMMVAVSYGLMLFHANEQDLSQNVNFDALLSDYAVPMLAIAIAGGGMLIWAFVQQRYGADEQIRLNRIAKERETQLRQMRERAKAISQMTTLVSGTLDFEKILEAAMDIGDLMLRNIEGNHRVISMILLFREDDQLYIENSRGLKSEFEGRRIAHKQGVIARALAEATPIITAKAAQDPILAKIPGMRQIRSLLCVPLRAEYDNFGVLIYASTAPSVFDPDQIDIMQAIGVQATIALQNAVLRDSLVTEKERIIQMEEDARKSLVRDLHDIPTQTVSGIAMRLRIAIRTLETKPDEVSNDLVGIEKMALRATEEIRHVLFKLRPLALETQGLIAALHQLAEKMQNTYQQKVNIRVSPDVETALNEMKQGALFYLVEEAVNNARKYAEASQIAIQGKVENRMILIQVADNGKGFDTGAVEAGYENRGSFGMINMRERAELLDGSLDVQSTLGKGTAIRIMIPVDDGSSRERSSATKFSASAQDTLSRL